MLPELPIPGPAAHANSEPGSALLYHRSLVDEASQLLASPANEDLMTKLGSALSATSGSSGSAHHRIYFTYRNPTSSRNLQSTTSS